MDIRERLARMARIKRRNQEHIDEWKERQRHMPKIQLTREEQETTIVMNAADKEARIFTADPVFIRKLQKLTEEHPETYRLTRTDPSGGGYWFICPKDRIRFAKPATEAQKEHFKKIALQREETPIDSEENDLTDPTL